MKGVAMADDDQSLATKVENWIVTQLKAIQIDAADVFEDIDVTPWPGTIEDSASHAAEELFSSERRLIAQVYFQSDQPVEMEAGVQFFDAIYIIIIGIKNDRPGAARRGDGVGPGTNILRELVEVALHNQTIGLSSNNRVASNTRWLGMEHAYLKRDAVILIGRLAVREEWSNQ
jgi:hypothetical protein